MSSLRFFNFRSPNYGRPHVASFVASGIVEYNDASGVTIYGPAADGDIVRAVWSETQVAWDGDGTVNIGDASDPDGFAANGKLDKGNVGYHLLNPSNRGDLLYDGTRAVDYALTSGDSVVASVTTGTSTQGRLAFWIEILPLKGHRREP